MSKKEIVVDVVFETPLRVVWKAIRGIFRVLMNPRNDLPAACFGARLGDSPDICEWKFGCTWGRSCTKCTADSLRRYGELHAWKRWFFYVRK